ncbi:MAG: hypothetical protein R6V85_15950 [Polyangia bacterium]
MSMEITFGDGGVWMYVIAGLGVMLFGGVIAQLLLLGRNDFTQVLRGGVEALFLVGMLGSVVGFIQGMSAVAGVGGERIASMAARVMAIAPLPVALAAALAIPAAILVGLARTAIRKRAERTADQPVP